MKITQKYINRMRNSKHVQGKIQELCELYGFDVQYILVLLLKDGTIMLRPTWACVEAQSKCHPDDKFDINKGLELAFARLAEKLGVSPKWEPKGGEEFYRVTWDDGLIVRNRRITGYLRDELDIALGNCFKTEEDATKHARPILERYQKLIAYAKELNK